MAAILVFYRHRHETGNYNSYPRLLSLLAAFNSSGTTIRPYWLAGATSVLTKSGLLGEVDDWATASEQLYVLCWKIDIEVSIVGRTP